MYHPSFQVPPLFLNSDFQVQHQNANQSQLHVAKIPPAQTNIPIPQISPDIIKSLLNAKIDQTQSLQTEFGVQDETSLQQVRLQIFQIIKQRGFEGIRQIPRNQLQLFLDSTHQSDSQLKQSIFEYLVNPIDKELIEAKFDSNLNQKTSFSVLNQLQKIKDRCTDQQPRGTKRLYTKKLISFLLGDGKNPYLGRMIFSQIGTKLADFHRLKINNSFAYFHVSKGSENLVFNEENNEEMGSAHLYATAGRTVVVEHMEPFSLGVQLPGMAMKPSFMGHTQNIQTFKEIVDSKFYGKNATIFPYIPISNLINYYEALDNLKLQLKPFFVQELVDHAVPVLELCHGIAPFASYQQQNRFLLTRNRNGAIGKSGAQKVENKLRLNSSQFVIRELPLAFTVGQFIPTKGFDMKQADSKQAKTSLQQSQQDPKMILAEMYRRERSAHYYYRIVQSQDDKKLIDQIASDIFPRENKNKDYLKIDGNRVVYNGLDENNKIEELTKHMLIYENQIATCQYVQSFWDKTKALNYFYQIFSTYNKYPNQKLVEDKFSHVWFQLDRFLGWMNLSQSLITNNRIAKYYWISAYQPLDQNQHVLLSHNTFKSFAPVQIYTKCNQIDNSIVKQLKFSQNNIQNTVSHNKKVEEYGRKDSVKLQDPVENSVFFNVNAQRIQLCHKFDLIGQTFMHSMTQEQQRMFQNCQARYDQAFRKLESIDIFTDEAKQQVNQNNYSKRRKNLQNQQQQIEYHLNLLFVDIQQIKNAVSKMQQHNQQPSQLDNAEHSVFREDTEFRKLLPTKIKDVMYKSSEHQRQTGNNDISDTMYQTGQKIVHAMNEFINRNRERGPIVRRYIEDNMNQMEKATKYFSESGDTFNQLSHDIFSTQLDKLLSKEPNNIEPIRGYKSTQNNTSFKQEGKVINEQVFINYEQLQQIQKLPQYKNVNSLQEYQEAMLDLGKFLKNKKPAEREVIEFQIHFSNQEQVTIIDKICYDDASTFIKQLKDVKEFINEYNKLDEKSQNSTNSQYKHATSTKFIQPPIPGNQNANFQFQENTDGLVQYINLQQSYLNKIEFHEGYCLINFDKPLSEIGNFVTSAKSFIGKKSAIQQEVDWNTAFQHDLTVIDKIDCKIDIELFFTNRKKFIEQIKAKDLFKDQISMVSESIKQIPMTQAQIFEKQVSLADTFFKFDGGEIQLGIMQYYTKMTQQYYDAYAKINDNKRPDFLDDIQKLLSTKVNLSVRYVLIKYTVHLLKLVLQQCLYVIDPWKIEDIQSEKSIRQLFRKEAFELDGRYFGTRSFWGSVLYLMDELRNWNLQYDEENTYYFALRAGDIIGAHESSERGLLTAAIVRQEQILTAQILEEDIFETECRRKGFL